MEHGHGCSCFDNEVGEVVAARAVQGQEIKYFWRMYTPSILLSGQMMLRFVSAKQKSESKTFGFETQSPGARERESETPVQRQLAVIDESVV